MAVLLPNARLGVRRREYDARDAHGEPVPGVLGPVVGPWPGRKVERADGSWLLGVDPAAWPLRALDLVVDPDSDTSWLVGTAQVMKHPVDPVVDYVRVEARERRAGSTEPEGMATPSR